MASHRSRLKLHLLHLTGHNPATAILQLAVNPNQASSNVVEELGAALVRINVAVAVSSFHVGDEGKSRTKLLIAKIASR